MTDTEFDDWFKYLEDYHNRPQTPAAKERYREEFEGVSDELFAAAIKAATRKYAPGKFPSPEELGRFIDDARARCRPKTAAETPPDPEEGKAVLQRLRAELEQRDREKEQLAAEKWERDRQDLTQRTDARKELLEKQAQSLLHAKQREEKTSTIGSGSTSR
jgi:hypothetical protein